MIIYPIRSLAAERRLPRNFRALQVVEAIISGAFSRACTDLAFISARDPSPG